MTLTRNVESSTKTSNELVYAGEDITHWFKLDRQVKRWARKKFGDIGEKLWKGSMMTLTQATVGVCANEVYWYMVENKSLKDANMFWSWNTFWTVAYQQSWREKAMSDLVDYVESHTDGKALKFVTELAVADRFKIRAKMQTKFACATAARVTSLETEYEAGMPSAPGIPVFPKGVNCWVNVF
jgi:hypothetical protein